MKVGIDFFEINPKIFNLATDHTIKVQFEAKNATDKEEVAFNIKLTEPSSTICFIDAEGREIESLNFIMKIGKRWKKYTKGAILRIREKPDRATPVMLEISTLSSTGVLTTEKANITYS